MGLLLPLDARSRGRRRFFLPLSPPPNPKKTPTPSKKTPTTFHVLEGRQHNGRPSHVSPLFLPIKTGEEKKKTREEREERGRKKERTEERVQRREEKEEKREGEGRKKKKKEARKRMKNRGEREKKNSTAGHCDNAAACRLQ